jgi:hypothetical protein
MDWLHGHSEHTRLLLQRHGLAPASSVSGNQSNALTIKTNSSVDNKHPRHCLKDLVKKFVRLIMR